MTTHTADTPAAIQVAIYALLNDETPAHVQDLARNAIHQYARECRGLDPATPMDHSLRNPQRGGPVARVDSAYYGREYVRGASMTVMMSDDYSLAVSIDTDTVMADNGELYRPGQTALVDAS